ncbi:MAG: uracil-DNA glycosylase, partial [Bacteroidetes bacterium]|nr:uracil-DNA glycosylase [Bacteroidota bacterium]
MTAIAGINPEMERNWKQFLAEELSSLSFCNLMNFLDNEKKHYNIYPEEHLIFNAFNKVPFDKIKVVIIGQDPYHGQAQAHGLCFSVPDGIKPPRSLINIYKELQSDTGMKIPASGNLEHWAEQGV